MPKMTPTIDLELLFKIIGHTIAKGAQVVKCEPDCVNIR